jgi:hypothetical protein
MVDAASYYARLRECARQIASRHPPAAFYSDHAAAVEASRALFEIDPLVAAVRQTIATRLEDDFGHGHLHALKVAVDAGALIHIEGRAAGYSREYLTRRICIAHCAGLLHDIQRKQRNHAEQGASQARELLAAFPFSGDEIEDICIAIRNHEAFRRTLAVNTVEGTLVSGCLYDADKFRWGPDNFTDTLWDMIAFTRPAPSDFIKHYPAGMDSLARIKSTFRTATGKVYGPGFIDLGIAIGEELYRAILNEFCELPV